jgi:hypothetical protein
MPVWDPTTKTVYISVTQSFHIRFNPFPTSPSTLLVRLTLRKEHRNTDGVDGKWYIAFQEDFYHADDLVSLVIPPVAPIIRVILAGAGWVSGMNAWFFSNTLGWWRESGREKQKDKDIELKDM